ncbi:secreted RxLR effector protein 161-like [Malania oleifera]|uniref:secreted RxLR effector protein 161-like n=1 Tax=Malania oleifera TaxID=397392 RepID=UPI0025ADB330|nr:secreted RxLR effector protein 161-like [Malania oleifera]
MAIAKPVSTPLASHFRLSTAQCPSTDDEVRDMLRVPYASAAGCLMYLRGTTGYGIEFRAQQSDLTVVGYEDTDYAGDLDDRRSTTGYVFTLVGRPICWRFMVQSLMALSITESEYMTVAKAVKETLWLTRWRCNSYSDADHMYRRRLREARDNCKRRGFRQYAEGL